MISPPSPPPQPRQTRQVYLQHQVARRVAADLEVLPGHEIHIDPALLFFILKVHRDRSSAESDSE